MQRRVITLGHSPDPDDAFMFYALAANKIETGELEFRHIIEDIETLNRRAMNEELDVTAVSIHAYAYVHHLYALLPCGASMGEDYGPIVIAREPVESERLRTLTVAIPGKMTTAYLAFRLWLGDCKVVEIPFDRIMEAVRSGEVDAGLLIHEGQLTWSAEGFTRIVDLGEWWNKETGLPLPLGGNVVKKSLGNELMNRISRLLRQSIEYGLAHRAPAVEHSMAYARGMESDLTDRFVGMYVNDYTLEWGGRGRQAVELLLKRGFEAGVIPSRVQVEFVG